MNQLRPDDYAGIVSGIEKSGLRSFLSSHAFTFPSKSSCISGQSHKKCTEWICVSLPRVRLIAHANANKVASILGLLNRWTTHTNWRGST